MKTKKFEIDIERNTEAIACPDCDGYADRVDLTTEEIKAQGCGRTYECCGRAFVCRKCKTRWVGEAPAPEME